MPDLAQIIVNGSHTPWLYLPAALLLGALHAAEPGHSKSLMAAFIVAIRGTPKQAVLLGVSAALGHSLVVWAIALIGLSLGDALILDKAEPWLLLASSAIIAVLGGRLVWAAGAPHRHDHDHAHDHHDHDHDHHDHDAHAAAHARDIAARFGGAGPVGAGQIAWFGFTGGLTPCPAAITVLIVCLQVKALALGAGMVAAFSIGLAVTLVGIGIAASLGLRHAAGRGGRLAAWAEALPLISGLLILVLALNFAVKGLRGLGVL
ncbi:nickel/cobalt efflux transporter [Elstera cyanobacteriorum]|uniref:nickel/cobalt efflux transporter n=1 Tax=Elstera cyanobacteriorum TaxID=2022747 RepID=UPI002354C376|nr:nickel/cobalt efflux transporter [Elstera cyanobacteriorum]MCK6443226.1 nickel/cobalt efflux transporter RcnA [Elstera cyanobacteriorum]